MADFDTLEVDVTVHCHHDPQNCSEWDRIAYVWACDDEACETRYELVRWITPYSRPGLRRWVMDATPMLSMLRDGGERTFRVEMGPGWEAATERDVAVSLRLSTRGDLPRATGFELAFRGGGFNAEYNARYEPFPFTPPGGAARVELVTIISGHGQTDGDNCAEWCNHEHHFEVNGNLHLVSYPGQAGQPFGCAERVIDGVPPGQWGNWAPLRAGWCPGLPVDAVRFDITDEVELGAENVLTYRGQFASGEPRGGNVDMSTFVVFYE